MANKSMSDVLNDANLKHLSMQKEQGKPLPATAPFNPIKAYSNQLANGSKKPRGKHR